MSDARKIIILLNSLFASLVCGSLYAYSVFAPALKVQLDYTQTEINLAGSLGDIGLYLGITTGLLYDFAGPFVTCFLGSILSFIGYFLVYGSVSQWYSTPTWLLSLFLFLVGQGNVAGFTSCLLVSSKTFSEGKRGIIVGLNVGFFAMSSVVLSFIYRMFFKKNENIKGYMLVLAIVSGVVLLISSIIFKIFVPPEPKATNSGNIVLQEETQPISVNNTDRESNLDLSPLEVDVYGIELIKNIDFWMLFFIMFVGTGAGLVVINGLGSIIHSLNYSDGIQTTYVIVLGFSSLFGRLLVGLASDRFDKKIRRSFWLIVSLLVMSFSHILFAFDQYSMVLFLVIATGFAYGSIFANGISLNTIYFGVKHSGMNYGFITLATASGGLTLSVISGHIYDRLATDNFCYGEICWRYAFLMTGILCVVAIPVAIVLTKRRK